ncbi:hypothetical protein GOODEAATRI_008842 [Goodea atripinnis]|uniref:Uncharacterized protein n=1 Tax=Goodea atripinnis TaxID=208336 RepID=A0ABV0MZT5_9TELE
MSTLSVTDVGHDKKSGVVLNHEVLSGTSLFSLLSDESKVFDGTPELQLDCMAEESSGNATMKPDGLLSLTDLSQPDDFPVPSRNGTSLTEMSSALPVEPNDIKLDPSAADASGSVGKWLEPFLFGSFQ